ncbi:hypothetical protein Taro_039050 [Colocasia esculenta]|uniref:CCHC-type domain-containing protein n=1 Tax=Colocasia esculenta TaxID=4460 RepID=A0A843WFH8_COLES|nr:hypothetical protein [Colocasia esculenta]
MVAEEPVMQVEKFLRLQPPTYTGGLNPDIAEHWIHEVERVFTTMRCPAVDKVVLATYQLRGFAQQWWHLKMQTTFAGRSEELRKQPREQLLLRDLFGLIRQVGQVRVVFGYLSRQQELVRERLQQDLLLQVLQGRGYTPKVEESQQSTARQSTIPPGYRCYNCNQPGHLICNCPYPREYGYGRGVQQQQQPQQSLTGRGGGVPQQRGRGRVMAITRAQAEASNMIEGFLNCMTHPLEEKSCELVVEVPSGEFMLTSNYIDEAPVVIGGNQMPVMEEWVHALGVMIVVMMECKILFSANSSLTRSPFLEKDPKLPTTPNLCFSIHTASLILCPELGQSKISTNKSSETVTIVPFTEPVTDPSAETWREM